MLFIDSGRIFLQFYNISGSFLEFASGNHPNCTHGYEIFLVTKQ